jgi:hypothetical protein
MSRLARTVRTAARVALGLFVVWQFLFLLSSNLLSVEDAVRAALHKSPPVQRVAPDLFDGKGAAHATLRAVERVTERWAELTGQAQCWQLFAPDVADVIPFLAVELRWDDDRLPRAAARTAGRAPPAPPVLLPSENEPADPGRFFRAGRFRLRRYETTLDLAPAPGRPFDPRGEDWAAAVERDVRAGAEPMLAYLRWRLAAFRRARPDLPPPTQVVLHVRLYRVPPPPGPTPWRWEYLGQHRVARWLPGAPVPAGYLPVETYDPPSDSFVRLGRWP